MRGLDHAAWAGLQKPLPVDAVRPSGVALRYPTGCFSQAVDAARTIARLARRARRGRRARAQALARRVEAMIDAGFFRLCVPRSVGGGEADPATLVAVCEELARGDAAAGWCIAVMATGGMLAAYLAEDAAREVYGDRPRSPAACSRRGAGRVATASGYRVTGRWPFSSGVDHCDWLMGGCIVERGRRAAACWRAGARTCGWCCFPTRGRRGDRHVDVSGLRATGSHDIAARRRARCRAARAASRDHAGTAASGGPLYAFPLFGLLALTIAGDGARDRPGGDRGPGRARRRQDAHRRARAARRARRHADADRAGRGGPAARGARVPLRGGRDRMGGGRARGEVSDRAAGGAAPGGHATRPRRRPRPSTPPTTSAAAPRSTRRARFSGASATSTPPRSTCWSAPSTWELTGRLLLGPADRRRPALRGTGFSRRPSAR